MATYLTCPRKRGLQKKHIDVCHRCDFNVSCEPFQEYLKGMPETEGNETPPTDQSHPVSGGLLRDIVKELKEIKILLADRGMGDESYITDIIDILPSKEISIDFLKKELKLIKEL
jgi:hypothetical protein